MPEDTDADFADRQHAGAMLLWLGLRDIHMLRTSMVTIKEHHVDIDP